MCENVRISDQHWKDSLGPLTFKANKCHGLIESIGICFAHVFARRVGMKQTRLTSVQQRLNILQQQAQKIRGKSVNCSPTKKSSSASWSISHVHFGLKLGLKVVCFKSATCSWVSLKKNCRVSFFSWLWDKTDGSPRYT